MNQKISQTELAEIESLVGTPQDVAFQGPYEGASRIDRQIAGWHPPLMSADMDILDDKNILDARSRDLNRNDAYVQGGGRIHKDSIVGSFYMVNSRPAWAALGKDEEWAEAFQQEVEELFTLWAESPQKWVDSSRNNDLTELIRLAVGVYTFSGEVLATVEWRRDRGREFRTAIQMIDTDRLSTPSTRAWDQNIRGGIKLSKFGEAQSYFIRTQHPNDYALGTSINGFDVWKEVAARKPWGRQMVIHLREQNRVGQTRAVSDIVAGLKEVAITKKFRDVTLQNAVVNAMYAATIESELPTEVLATQLGTENPGEGAVAFAQTYLGALAEYSGAAKGLMIDGAKIPHMFPGTKLHMQPAGTPGGVGQEFEASLLRYIATNLGVSYEELSRDYTKTNYSSARAAMANTWKFMQSRKKIVADAMANHIFRLWLEEAINQNRLKSFPASEAPMLYTDGYLNLMFDALSRADWIGAARGQIDELKETQAAVLRIKYGLSTHEDELARLGKDWRKTYAQLERERKEREKRKIELLEDNSVNAASGSPREQEGNEPDDDQDAE